MAGSILEAIALLIGTIVGAGVFALPAAAARAGFPVALAWLALLSLVVLILHLMYGEIVLRTPEKHRLPGYAGKYLGVEGMRWALVSVVLGSVGALYVYLILSVSFLRQLLPFGVPEHLAGIALWGVFTAAVLFGIRTVARLELWMSLFLIVLMGMITGAAAPHISAANLIAVGPRAQAIFPYGVLLFSLWGIAAVPEMRELFDATARGFRRAIAAGTVIPAILYGMFMLAFVGAFGSSADAPIGEVVGRLGPNISTALIIFGLFTVATSYFVIGAYFADALRYDIRMRRATVFGALSLPLLLFLVAPHNFLFAVALIGGILGAIDGTLIVRTWVAAKTHGTEQPAFRVALPRGIASVMIALFIGGAFVELITVLRNLL